MSVEGEGVTNKVELKELNLKRRTTLRTVAMSILKAPFKIVQAPIQFMFAKAIRSVILPARNIFKDPRPSDQNNVDDKTPLWKHPKQKVLSEPTGYLKQEYLRCFDYPHQAKIEEAVQKIKSEKRKIDPDFPAYDAREHFEKEFYKTNSEPYLVEAKIYHRYVITEDNAVLDTYDIEPTQKNKCPVEQGIKHIIYFNGNGEEALCRVMPFTPKETESQRLKRQRFEQWFNEEFYTDFAPFQLAADTGCCVTNFNYRGVGSSSDAPGISGVLPSFNDWIEDGVAQVFHVLAMYPDLQLDQIELHGDSVGGAIATGVARRLDYYCQHPDEVPAVIKRKFNPGKEPYLFNVRSLRSFTAFVMAVLIGSSTETKSGLWWAGLILFSPIILPVVAIVSLVLNLSSMEAYPGIWYSQRPAGKSDHVLVESTEEQRRETEILDDRTILPFAALGSSPLIAPNLFSFEEKKTAEKRRKFTSFNIDDSLTKRNAHGASYWALHSNGGGSELLTDYHNAFVAKKRPTS